jgi:hypothetical protein
MFRSSVRSSSGSTLFISLSMLLILKTIKIFKKYDQSIVVMWQRMFMPVMRTVWKRALDSSARLLFWGTRRGVSSQNNPPLRIFYWNGWLAMSLYSRLIQLRMYVALRKAEKHVLYGELVGTTECITPKHEESHKRRSLWPTSSVFFGE